MVTGRLCVAASASPEETKLILRHELVHLNNHDMWLWQLLLSFAPLAAIVVVLAPLLVLLEVTRGVPVEGIQGITYAIAR